VIHKLKFIIISVFFLTLVSSCQTIKEKTDIIVEKENNELSQYIGETSSNLQMNLGKPDEDFKNEKGNLEFVYNSKKYLIPCERRFEINPDSIVIGFVSNGCF
jgi:Tol biopolymer transport system component